MQSPAILRNLDEERELVERDLAVGEWRRARRRAGSALERLDGYLRSLEPEIGSWMRTLRILADAHYEPEPAGQLPLWPHLGSRRSRNDASDPADRAEGTDCGAPTRPAVPGGRMRIITRDRALLDALALLERLAPTELPVFLEGETGTGKEVVAVSAHAISARKQKPFIAVNCGAIPTELHESELFGHMRGAYTGATMEKAGLFEAAHGGTLFLDEIGEMESRAQVKLLRVLESGELRRLGETRTRKVDVRVISATNHDVDAAIREGRFRKDLFYRLSAVRILLPPLRERRRDILPLALHFLRQFAARPPLLTPGAETALLAHDWPGNVRELKLVCERACALWRQSGEGEIRRELIFPPAARPPESETRARLRRGGCEEGCQEPRGATPGSAELDMPGELPGSWTYERFLESIERRLIRRALERSGGNRTMATRFLGGMCRTTLIGKMKRLGIFEESSSGGEASLRRGGA